MEEDGAGGNRSQRGGGSGGNHQGAKGGGEGGSSQQQQQQQETFQRAQETQVEHRYPARPTGIISLPPGSRGPRSLYLRRHGDSFGFTLRHFIVYPPDSVQDVSRNVRQPQVGNYSTPMDTIFVKNVSPCSSAEQAGLQHGDRIVAVNGVNVSDRSYAQVVYLIQNSPEYLHLLVVAKEDDVLQKFFSEAAHNPISNTNNNKLYHYPRHQTHVDLNGDQRKALLHRPLPQVPVQQPHQLSRSSEFQVDALSWKSLQDAVYSVPNLRSHTNQLQQRSADNLLYATPLEIVPKNSHNRSADILHESVVHRPSRAQPQVPLFNRAKMGRRASESSSSYSSNLDQPEYCEDSSSFVSSNRSAASTMVVGSPKVPTHNHQQDQQHGHPSPRFVYPSPPAEQSPLVTRANELHFVYPNSAGCRLSLDGGGRRESSASVSSSLADGSKDSLSSYDSMSTLTGQDDSVIMTRLRKNLAQKEEFMRRPSHPVEAPAAIQREFYGRPKKLEKTTWPPPGDYTARQHESPSHAAKPVHQNFQRVKTDIEMERGEILTAGDTPSQPKSDKQYAMVVGMKEASPAPESLDNQIKMNGAAACVQDEDRQLYLKNLQVVTKRAKQFESGRPLPEDDPACKDRTSFYRSELARISSKCVVPNVPTRAHEFENRSSEPRRDTSGSSTNSGIRRHHRDSRSLDSSGSNASSGSINEIAQTKLSGNVIIFGSNQIHVPPPANYKPPQERPQDVSKANLIQQDTSSLFPDTIQMSQAKGPSISITPSTPEPFASSKIFPVRPNQLDLYSPIRPARRLHHHHQIASLPEDSARSSISAVDVEDHQQTVPPVVIRRNKNASNLGDEERAMRRESYLKATGNGRMQVDDLSDDGEVSPQLLRSAHRKWRPPLFPGDIQQLRKLFEDAAYSWGGSLSGGSSSSVSLEREKISLPSSPLDKEPPVVREGLLHCKIAEIDGKRAADRSWKQVWVVLRGPRLFLYKDRHHQSPSDAAEQSLASGIDMSASCVRIAEDYTKRKHVLRVSSVLPCRSELLLQTENPVDLADWVKALQEQVASNDTENKSDAPSSGTSTKQQAVPQSTPALTTVQVQGSSRLSPQPAKSKLPSLRNRSPTGQSPASKTRKPSSASASSSQVNEGLVSPKSKTWRGRVVKQFRKIQGASSPSSPTAPEGSTFEVPLEMCYPSNYNSNVPRLVEVCTEIVESKGLDTVGVYRVPGNSAAITALTNSVNQSYDGVPQIDAQWNDVHVVSSLLKSFFRKLPDALLTSGLYTSFIEADKIEDAGLRMEEIRKLVKCLPSHHYYTLRHLMLHLKKVTDNCDINKMEGRNLAIVFGPTLIRGVQDDMATLVNDMSHNYKIVESLINHAEWFFSEDDVSSLNLQVATNTPVDSLNNEVEVVSNRALLLDNISKVEGMKGEKAPGRELFSSIISAAHRKMRKGGSSKSSTSQDSRDDLSSPTNGPKEFIRQPDSFSNDLIKSDVNNQGMELENTSNDNEKSSGKSSDRLEKSSWLNYSDQDQIRKRVENFIQETQANLQRNRRTAEFTNSVHNSQEGSLSSLPNNPLRYSDQFTLTKTQSASNVFHRPSSEGNKNSNLSNSALAVQYSKNSSELADNKSSFLLNDNKNSVLYKSYDLNRNSEIQTVRTSSPLVGGHNDFRRSPLAMTETNHADKALLRRGSSVENVNSSILDLTRNSGTLKKIKYGNENDNNLRTGSLDSLHKLHEADDGSGSDLQASIMKIFDEKKKTLNPLLGVDLPYADESPERPTPPSDYPVLQNKETILTTSPKIYRNPSLHKNSLTLSKLNKTIVSGEFHASKETQKEKLEEEKDRDSAEFVPDNDRHISITNHDKSSFLAVNNVKTKSGNNNTSRLRRSESLNKPDRTVSPLNVKLKRSESLNKTSDRLKRSDSLTKTEKTENNINKRRELSATRRTNKELTKLKRKNGMPERSIKRRHTVGGTKDFDKVNWLDNRYQEKDSDAENQNKEKCTLRTSSPDLSSTRRERLLFEVNLFGPENIVVALRQHLIGVRPQSLPEPSIYKVPLESHV